ncbi:APC family permease [Cellulomonas alba]|uniref:APC family permease n=1 Tax=Cellulomonas alba TaxID=3053467 RepID=A0ABT7SII4_9CELL|nr:APC family permease [Cellulomonas alba]MDM7855996.1 APC family permease [Cellulomonas alba]
MAEPAPPASTRLTVRGAIMLGVGSMVGAGIFALLGQAGAVAGSAVWLSFVIAGAMSGALGYTLVKLAVRYPSSGGIVVHLQHGFASRRLVGVAAWLGYLTAIVVVGAMVAASFGDYAAVLLAGAPPGGWLSRLCAAALVVLGAWLTVAGPRLVDRVQSVVVGLLLAVFAVFVVGTLPQVDASLLAPSTYPDLSDVVASVALTFFAFLGFAVISFVGGDLRAPRRELPVAMYGALAITTVLYVAVSVCLFGTLPVQDVVDEGPRALAVAAEPALGHAGYTMMTLAALLATSSTVTAMLYGSRGLTEELARSGTFPPAFGSTSRLGRHGGLVITTVLMLLFVTVLGLGALASVGSAVSLSVFVLVAVAAWRLRREIGAASWLTATAIAVSGVVLAWFVVDLFRSQRHSFWAMVALVALAVVVDAAWTRRRDRRRPRAAPLRT